MLRRWLPQIGLAVFLGVGAVAWGSLSLRGTNEWVSRVTKGMCFDDLQEISTRAVAIVPGSGFINGHPNAQLNERLTLALSLYEAGRVGAVLVSGDEERAGHEASGMQQWLIDRGVPSSRVIVDPSGIRTLATMTRAAHLFGIHDAIICTQRWAAPRALFLARGSGIDAIALVPRASSRVGRTENLKIALAFVERYLLGRTNTALPGIATIAMKTSR